METSFSFQVSGPRALFSDPFTKFGGEKSTYGVPTAEALRGIAESIYWKPTIEIIIDKVRIMNPIRKVSSGRLISKLDSPNNDLAIYQYLKDVCYEVNAHFIHDKRRPDLKHDYNENKHLAIMERAIKKGGRRTVCLGCTECTGVVTPCEFGKNPGYYDNIDIDLDRMFLTFDYPDFMGGPQLARFAQLSMEKGVIDFSKAKNIVEMPIRKIEKKAYNTLYTPVDREYKEAMK